MNQQLSRYFSPLKLLLTALLASAAISALAEADKAEQSEAPIQVTDETFNCIRDMTKVRGFYVDNLLGDLDGTLEVANSSTGGVYPPGSVVQLVPGEVMVKHQKGFNPATKDWEFFELDVSEEGSKIRNRGFVDVVNRFGGNCFACHVQAKPQWDLICETGHGCEPIPLTKEILALLQKTDPRCESNPELNQEEIAKLQALQQALLAKEKEKENK
ncbi:hypothetical protein [Microbulbifer sp. A4B17]|uniref:hypothetical protein n=1 Tax=Microbulbifer sp. A4B17 TaxID=359370 RepID=UPI00192D9D95|nr:hypothetical protein [Microbulbifer sp. A4B17]